LRGISTSKKFEKDVYYKPKLGEGIHPGFDGIINFYITRYKR